MTAAIDPRYLPPPVPDEREDVVDVRSMLASEWARDRLFTISATSDRSVQAHLGPSEIGAACPRRLAYRIAGTPVVNLADPLKAMFGTGLHGVIAAGLLRMDQGVGRYLVEHAVTYRGVSGSVDLFDRYTGRVTDWKTTTKSSIKRYRRDALPANYVVQAHIYAQGLLAAGEQVDTVALTFIPRDGELRDVWTWTTTPKKEIADQAIDRYLELTEAVKRDGPAGVQATPTTLCTYCPNYRPNATDLTVACPGGKNA